MTRELNDAGTALRERVEARVGKEVGDSPGVDIVRPPLLNAAAQALQDYFTKKVRYLGPLRESPKPLYPLEALSDPTDVGYRGEHTAAVLDLNKRKPIWFVAPPDDSGRFPERGRAPLQSAVVEWLRYMDLVSDVATGDRGKFGRELQVSLSGVPKLHDLTNVGVGVSQVLPIIVMALLAPDDSTLVLEQPELHLHPRVQSRLGDFLLSLSALGKQTVIETKREHLIHRLRRRVAESDSDIGSTIGLYYVERIGGESKVRRVDINKFGALSEWPKGFFDPATHHPCSHGGVI